MLLYPVNADVRFDAWRVGDTVEIELRVISFRRREDAADAHIRDAYMRPRLFGVRPEGGWMTVPEGDSIPIETWIRAGDVTFGEAVPLRLPIPLGTSPRTTWIGFRTHDPEVDYATGGSAHGYAHIAPRIPVSDLPTVRFRRAAGRP